ncbi:hypothetical protein DFH09DRAFT_1099017 [Mycena vulgaris]|nr:hypothetical protein DFH09DRAFT_1099017 [Mycena vulgaris]
MREQRSPLSLAIGTSKHLPPPADRQDLLPASHYTSEAPLAITDPIAFAETIPIPSERPLIPVTDTEVDTVIMSSSPWKAPDRYGIQMGSVQRSYVVTRDWIFAIFKASIALGVKPFLFKANATFEDSKRELIHHSPGRADLSNYCVSFNGVVIQPSESVKWAGVWIDSKLTGDVHIKARAPSAARALNASLALTHAVWGLKPLMIRDLARAVVFPRADYAVSSFFPVPAAALKPLERVKKSIAHCITGGYRTASLAALEKEAAILPATLRLESALLHRLARYLSLPPLHGIVPLLQDATPRTVHRASPLHLVERLPAVRWPAAVPARGTRIRDRKARPPTDVTTETRADRAGSGARGKRGGAVTEQYAQGRPPPAGGRQVPVAAPPVARRGRWPRTETGSYWENAGSVFGVACPRYKYVLR